MEINGANSINGEIKIPGDKSISHRSAIISSITKDTIVIKNYLFSQDCIRTLEVLRKLGVKIEKLDENLVICGKGIEGFREPNDILYAGNSGTTIRLLPGILSATNFMSILSGDSSVNNRPMARIVEPLRKMGAQIYGREENSKAPIVIFGNKNLKGRIFNTDISSAQVKSCITLAGLFAEGETEILQPRTSRDHTERMLEFFGANITFDGKQTKIIPDRQLKGKNLFIPGDLSSAAYFIVASLILKNSRILIRDIGVNPTRCHFLELIEKMGARIKITNKRIMNNEPIADIESESSMLNGQIIDKEFIPNIIDEIPVLCVAAAFAEGRTEISGAEELRFKESNRISAIASQFKKAGVDIEEKEDGFIIYGNSKLKISEGPLESFKDHRIAMSLAILGLRSRGKIKIMDSDYIDTSFPSFKYELKKSLN
ncbi:MAG: 3-phosphoshikimate 1-carboxyvinyltransferase [Actinobacteria bacterium]|nr:3-phosphoshikimate 1-carboxyvinyltransferase [Actinomycetota bacterium]